MEEISPNVSLQYTNIGLQPTCTQVTLSPANSFPGQLVPKASITLALTICPNPSLYFNLRPNVNPNFNPNLNHNVL